MGKRYKHWFWNSKLLMWVARRLVRFDSWLWSKQYAKKN